MLVVGDCQIEVLLADLAAVACWSSVLNCFQELFHGEPHVSTFSVIVNAWDFSFI